MTDEETEDLLNTIYPIGEERWVKVKYLNRDNARKSFRFRSSGEETKEDQDNGYIVTAIGVRDEYTPQVQAILDLKTDVASYLLNYLDPNDINHEQILDTVNTIFKEKMNDVKQHTIKTD